MGTGEVKSVARASGHGPGRRLQLPGAGISPLVLLVFSSSRERQSTVDHDEVKSGMFSAAADAERLVAHAYYLAKQGLVGCTADRPLDLFIISTVSHLRPLILRISRQTLSISMTVLMRDEAESSISAK